MNTRLLVPETTPFLNYDSITPGDNFGLHSWGIWYYPISNTTWNWRADWCVWDTDLVDLPCGTLQPRLKTKNVSELIFTLSHDIPSNNYDDWTGLMSYQTTIQDLNPEVKIHVEHLIAFIRNYLPAVEVEVSTSINISYFRFCIDKLRSKEKCDEFLLLCELHTLLQQYTYSSTTWMIGRDIMPLTDYTNRINLKSQSVYYDISFVEGRTALQTRVYWPKTLLNTEFDQVNIEAQFNETLCDYMPTAWPFKDYMDYTDNKSTYRALANVKGSEVFQRFEDYKYVGFQSRCKFLNNPYVFSYLLIILSHEPKYISIKDLNDFAIQNFI